MAKASKQILPYRLGRLPNNLDEILEVARHYFVVLKGNSFVKALFKDWLVSQNIDEPEWFKEATK